MASVQKFAMSDVVTMLRHCSRETINNSNEDIDKTRTHLNYKITLDGREGLKEYDYFKKRKSELYCINRSDVKVMAGWVITAPEGLSEIEEKSFFEATADFLSKRYGEKNIISLDVHKDEGVKVKVKDRWGNEAKKEDGSPEFKTVGQAHLHANFIPVVEDSKHIQGEKICAKEVINKKELLTFHKDLSDFLRDRAVKGWDKVYTGATAKAGGNRTVEQLKSETKGIAKTRTIEKEVSRW